MSGAYRRLEPQELLESSVSVSVHPTRGVLLTLGARVEGRFEERVYLLRPVQARRIAVALNRFADLVEPAPAAGSAPIPGAGSV